MSEDFLLHCGGRITNSKKETVVTMKSIFAIRKNILRSAAVMLTVLFLSSCSLSSAFGLGDNDYSAEKITGTLEQDCAKWRELEDMLGTLTVNSAAVAEFDNMRDAVSQCRDSLLNYMTNRDYKKYAGNSALLEPIAKKYPEYDIAVAVPQADFEAEMYKYFGGSVKITHKSTELFRYLEAAEVYVPITSPISGGAALTLTSAEETENTYRLRFTSSDGETELSYVAIAVKREDGTQYFSAVLRSE